MEIPRGALVVSCQARPDNPLHGPVFMAAMALAAVQGGAAGIRANGAADIAAIRRAVDVPIIGILKRDDPGFAVSITPDVASARQVVESGADIVALDATERPRRGEALPELIGRIVAELRVPVMADVATRAQGVSAARMGAQYIATTLSGYTGEAPPDDAPDLALVGLLAAEQLRVVAEGRYATADHIAAAFARGAHAVVVGTAITNPREITRKLARAAPWRG